MHQSAVRASTLVSFTMTATSVGITARVFGDLGALKSREAKTIIGAAVVDDILGLLILTVVVGSFRKLRRFLNS